MQSINLKSSDIEISSTKKTAGLSSLLFSIVLFLIGVGGFFASYFILNNTKKNLALTEEEMTNEISILSSQEFANLYDFESRIKDLEKNTTQRADYINFISFLQSKVFKNVWFQEMEITSPEGDDPLTLIATLKSSSFIPLIRQVQVFYSFPEVKKFSLKEIKVEGAEVVMQFEIIFSKLGEIQKKNTTS